MLTWWPWSLFRLPYSAATVVDLKAVVVLLAVESVSSSFSAVLNVVVVMVAVESVSSSFVAAVVC